MLYCDIDPIRIWPYSSISQPAAFVSTLYLRRHGWHYHRDSGVTRHEQLSNFTDGKATRRKPAWRCPPDRRIIFDLTGGTALGRGYDGHRFSEDLDFFVNDAADSELWRDRLPSH